jgi:membrane protein implicated in regulation of membrane protease activity
MPHNSLESFISRCLSGFLTAAFFGVFVAARGTVTVTFGDVFLQLLFFTLTYEILAAVFSRLFTFFENRRSHNMRAQSDTITVEAKEMK